MVISHRHKFIFVKTAKTAGTSVEVVLSQICGEEDVVTPFGIEEHGHVPRNYYGYYNHMPAHEIINRVGEEVWAHYLTFTVERNPWDKVVSHYNFVKARHDEHDLAFGTYLKRGAFPHNLRLYARIGDRGTPELLVDSVLQYENLSQQLPALLAHHGVSLPGRLPHAKGQYRDHRVLYESYYNDAQRKLIAHEFEQEIALFGYEFGSPQPNPSFPS
ncbi:MAG: sulfotransferase family 2 domain-containing protein [Pseudomonadota bacterium]